MCDQEEDKDKQAESNDEDNLIELKNSLRSQLHKSGMSNLIREMVRNICASQEDIRTLNPDIIIQEVYKKGLMNDFIQNLKTNSPSIIKHTQTTSNDENIIILKKVKSKSNKNKNSTAAVAVAVDNRRGDDDDDLKFTEMKMNHLMKDEDECIGADVGSNIYSSSSEDEIKNYGRQEGPMNGKYYLKMEILGGKSFLEHLHNDNMNYGHNSHHSHLKSSSSSSKFILHIFYKSQRFRSVPVKSSCEPKFNDTFMIELGSFENGSIFQLLAMNEPICIILVHDHEDASNKITSTVPSTTLMSHCLHDWRPILMSERCSQKFLLELKGIGPEHKIPIGLLSIRLSILPILEEQLTECTYFGHLTVEKTQIDEKNRLFLIYSKQWWREYIEIRPEHANRLVKLFSYDENTTSKPVINFIKPIVADRILQTPYHAVRFVKLLTICSGSDADNLLRQNFSLSASPKILGMSNNIIHLSNHWQTLESTIATKSGSIEDHAILLCSIFLGFGFDAYVGIGTKLGDIPWVWVITFENNFSPIFWDTTTGEKFEHLVVPIKSELMIEKNVRLKKNECHKFKTVSCIFNNKCFLANIQPSELIELTDWHLTNPSRWKKLVQQTPTTSPQIKIGSMVKIFDTDCCCHYYSPSLFSSRNNPVIMALELEAQLKVLISSVRQNHSLQTKWDDRISKIIGQEQVKCEMAVTSGVHEKLFPSHLINVILHYIPPGYDYKSFPFEFNFNDPQKIYYECLKEPECEKIIFCRGEDVNHSIRVDIFLYPEDVMSVRIIIACKFISVS